MSAAQSELDHRLSLAGMRGAEDLVRSYLAAGANPLRGAPLAACPLLFCSTLKGSEGCAALMLSAVESRGATKAGLACLAAVAAIVEPGNPELGARMRRACDALGQAKDLAAQTPASEASLRSAPRI